MGHRPSDVLRASDFAEACDVEQVQAELTLRNLGRGARATLDRLHPVLWCLWGADATSRLGPAGVIETDDDLDREVHAVAVSAGATFDDSSRLLTQARAIESLDLLRKQLGISLGDINAALSDLQREPIDYAQQHEEQFLLCVRAHWENLSLRLRWVYLESHKSAIPIKNWAALRDDSRLLPAADWRHTKDALTDQEILNEATRQLAAELDVPFPAAGPVLPPIVTVHQRNVDQAQKWLGQAGPLVHAWCRKNGVPIPVALTDVADTRPPVNLLNQNGALDFTFLGQTDLVRWARAVGVWPAKMPLTMRLDDLGLVPDDLNTARTEEERTKQLRQRERRTVQIEGTSVDVSDSLVGLRDVLKRSLEQSGDFLQTPARNTQLAPVGAVRARGSDVRSGGTSSSVRASDYQLAAIGFAGEWLVYQWLLQRFPAVVNEQCWVSRNRAQVFTGEPGDDGLGYDFAVPRSGGVVMYEVKSSTGEGGEIRLGESEVRAAQENARNRRWRLLVVTNVLSNSRQIRQLPNPFDARSRGYFNFAGQGLRLVYHMDR